MNWLHMMRLSKFLDSPISLSIKLDDHMWERCREKNYKPQIPLTPWEFPPIAMGASLSHNSPTTFLAPPQNAEPMQLGWAWLSPAERQKRLRSGECLYCSEMGHLLSNMPMSPTFALVSKPNTPTDFVPRTQIPATLHKQLTLSLVALIDWGRAESFGFKLCFLRNCHCRESLWAD